MSSLYRLIRKGNLLEFKLVEKLTPLDMAELYDGILPKLAPPNCILVNIQSVWDDLSPNAEGRRDVNDYSELLSCRPPFPEMFLEWATDDRRRAVQVTERGPDGFKLILWEEMNGQAVGPLAICPVTLDQNDDVSDVSVALLGIGRISQDDLEVVSRTRAYCALHAISRMNCRNVELRKAAAQAVEPKRKKKREVTVPACVWHEIVVTSVPSIRVAGKPSTGDSGTKRRASWIRGHYADYRKGNGLFGNPKLRAIFWIPEYKKGDEELGLAVPEYRLA